MKKFIVVMILASMLSVQSIPFIAGRGDGAAVAAGLIGGAMIGTMAAQSGRGARREAREAKRDVEEVRRERQQEKISDIRRQMERQQIVGTTARTTNLLILAILLLFIGFIVLAAMIFKKR